MVNEAEITSAILSFDGRVKIGNGDVDMIGRIGTRHSLARNLKAAPPS